MENIKWIISWILQNLLSLIFPQIHYKWHPSGPRPLRPLPCRIIPQSIRDAGLGGYRVAGGGEIHFTNKTKYFRLRRTEVKNVLFMTASPSAQQNYVCTLAEFVSGKIYEGLEDLQSTHSKPEAHIGPNKWHEGAEVGSHQNMSCDMNP